MQLLRPFDERELELIIGGLQAIDVQDWRTNTRLKHCTPETPQVQWFWQVCIIIEMSTAKILKIEKKKNNK